MAQQNKKQPKAKTGLARCLELASGHKGLVFLSGFLAALAAICSFIPYLSIYYIVREILFVYPDMSLLNVSTILAWGWLALAGILGNIVFYFFALLCSHIAAFGTLYELKVAFADHIMQIPLGYHLTLGSGKLRKITKTLKALRNLLLTSFRILSPLWLRRLFWSLFFLGLTGGMVWFVWSVLFWLSSFSLRASTVKQRKKCTAFRPPRRT